MRWSIVLAALLASLPVSASHAQISIADPSGTFTVQGGGWATVNPPVAQQRSSGDYYLCPNCGRYHYRQGDSHTTYFSATDPNRGYVDPGSMRYTTRWVWTPRGWVQQQVQSWNSFGVHHENGLQTNPDGSQHGYAKAPRGGRHR